MKKMLARTTAVIMAAMMAGTVGIAVPVSAKTESSSVSQEDTQAMKKALTEVKKRVTIPAELTEFNYRSRDCYNDTFYEFTWSDKKDTKSLEIHYVDGYIFFYCTYYPSDYTNEPAFSKFSEEQVAEKALQYIKQLNPGMEKELTLNNVDFSLYGDSCYASFIRYSNGIKVNNNYVAVDIDKKTGKLIDMDITWWTDAEFKDTKGMMNESEIQKAFKQQCELTPEYHITSVSEKIEGTNKYAPKNTARIVYVPEFENELDAFTGKPSTIWEDMKNSGSEANDITTDAGTAGAATEEEVEEESDSDVIFTPEELKKLEQNENLITTDEAFDMLKKDKYVALTDDYKMESYNIYNIENPKTGEETFYMELNYRVKSDKEKNFKSYKNINVKLNAETGDIIYLSKSGKNAESAKLNVAKANEIAQGISSAYSKDIIKEYKANERNTRPVDSWKAGTKTNYETSRNFVFNRYVNGILVNGDSISVTIDGDGTVKNYYVHHTEDVVFPSAKILTESQALDKFLEQKDFSLYYDGWEDNNGKAHTYLIYKMNHFYLDAKTGRECEWGGEPRTTYVSAYDVKYSDIKGIPQEKAIKVMQSYDVAFVNETKFQPDALITEQEFSKLLSEISRGYAVPIYEDVEVDEIAVEEEGQYIKTETGTKYVVNNKLDETTLREAAVMYGKLFLPSDVAAMNIFKSPYSNIDDTDKDAGYLAVAYTKGFITGSKGKLDSSHKITRAEAVQLIYDYVSMLSK